MNAKRPLSYASILKIPQRDGPVRRRVQVAVLHAIWYATVIVAAISVVGIVSSLTSRFACESRTAKYISTSALRGRMVHVDASSGTDAAAIFKSAGLQVAIVQPTSGAMFPYATIHHGRVIAPFLVDVDYAWSSRPFVAEGATQRYFCLFGKVIPIGKRTRFES